MAKKSVLIMVFITMLVSSLVLYAWIEFEEIFGFDLRPGEYEIEIYVYFGTTLVDSSMESAELFYDPQTKLLLLNAYDSTAINYIGNLRIVIQVKSHNTSRLRVRLLDQWELIRTYHLGNIYYYAAENMLMVNGVRTSPYSVSSDFFQKGEDPHYYYDGFLGKNETYQVEFIVNDGSIEPYSVNESENFEEQVFVKLIIVVEMVQANRAHKVWNIPINWFN